MAQTLSSPESISLPDLMGETYHWLGPIITEDSGRTVRNVYEAKKSPLTLNREEIASIKPIATVIITSPQDKTQYPDSPDYMIHIPVSGSRQERQRLQQIIADLSPLEIGRAPNSSAGSLPEPLNS